MDISEIFRKHISEYLQQFGDRIPYNHIKTINDILRCRTSDLGGNVFYCAECDKYHYSYHSCKNRHCPKCGSQDSGKWLEKQKERFLPVLYFMVTFTLPQELRSICRSNQKIFYSIMFKASSSALRTLLNDPKFAGGESGFTGILHTWTRQLEYHVHTHYIVPGGAFDFDRNKWNISNHKFLIPVKALSKIFRKNFESMLKKKSMKLYSQIPQEIWKEKGFNTNSIQVGKGEEVFTYMANYIYKTGITNNRVLSCKDGEVTFQYKESKTDIIKYLKIPVTEFIRRFLQHVLPSGFQKVRYYGFLSSASKKKGKIVADYFDVKSDEYQKSESASNQVKETFCRHCNTKMTLFASIVRKPRAPPYKMYDSILEKTKQIND